MMTREGSTWIVLGAGRPPVSSSSATEATSPSAPRSRWVAPEDRYDSPRHPGRRSSSSTARANADASGCTTARSAKSATDARRMARATTRHPRAARGDRSEPRPQLKRRQRTSDIWGKSGFVDTGLKMRATQIELLPTDETARHSSRAPNPARNCTRARHAAASASDRHGLLRGARPRPLGDGHRHQESVRARPPVASRPPPNASLSLRTR